MASSTSYTIVASFSDSSGFLNSLSPTCVVTLADGTAVASGPMTFVSDGRYRFSFTGQVGIFYNWRADGGVSLPHSIRYAENGFKENVVSSTDIRDALLEDPDELIAPGRESIDGKLRRLELLITQVKNFFGIPINYRR